MLAVLLLTAVAQDACALTWRGKGTNEEPYLIGSVAEWNQLAKDVKSGINYKGEYFLLGNNINFSGENNYTAIGTYSTSGSNLNKSFQGTFDGGGHTISNFTINDSGSLSYEGLFGYIGDHGTVKNLIISGLEVNVTSNAGAVAGRNEGTIEDIIVSNSKVIVFNNVAGGIAGNNYFNSGIIQNCHILGDVTIKCTSTESSTKIGGIVGYSYGSKILNCTNAATISNSYSTSSSYYGGIVGQCTTTSTIQNCSYLGGMVKASSNYGLIFGGETPTLKNNYYSQANIDENAIPDVTTNDGAVPALRNNSDNATALGLLKDRFDFLTSKNVTNENYATNYSIRLYGRTLYKDGYWNTLCLPFDVTLEDSDLDGATVKTLQSSSFGNSTLTLNFSNDLATIPAGQPCIIKWAASGDNIEAPLFTNVAVSVLNGSTVETDNVDFIGTFSPITLEDNDNTVLYLGANSTLYYPSADVTLNACRAYFKLNGLTAGEPTQVRAITLNFGEEESTGIVKAVANSSLFTLHSSLSEWYSLDGRRYADPTVLPKGVYIHNGRKVVIK